MSSTSLNLTEGTGGLSPVLEASTEEPQGLSSLPKHVPSCSGSHPHMSSITLTGKSLTNIAKVIESFFMGFGFTFGVASALCLLVLLFDHPWMGTAFIVCALVGRALKREDTSERRAVS